MKYLVTEIQHHKTGAIVINNTEKTNLNGTDGALRLFYEQLRSASISQSQVNCKIMIQDDNMNVLKYDEVINEFPEEEEPEA